MAGGSAVWGEVGHDHSTFRTSSSPSRSKNKWSGSITTAFDLRDTTSRSVFNPDRSKPKPWPRQDAWEFWTNVRDHVAHIHVKDATWNPAKNDADYNWPGDGQGCVREILKDAQARGYAAGLSIEPHMVTVFHDPNAKATTASDAARKNFVEYGKVLQELLA